VRQAKQIHGR